MLRMRHSRRSACDRCRNYKLRCLRAPPHGNACERCLKIGAACTTTMGPAGWTSRGNHSFPRASVDRSDHFRATTGILESSQGPNDEMTNQLPTPSSRIVDFEYSDLIQEPPAEFSLDDINFEVDSSSPPTRDSLGQHGLTSRQSLAQFPVDASASVGNLSSIQDSPPEDDRCEGAASHLKNVVGLLKELIDDLDALTSGETSLYRTQHHDSLGNAVQSVLRQTSRFSEILEDMASNEIGVHRGYASRTTGVRSWPAPLAHNGTSRSRAAHDIALGHGYKPPTAESRDQRPSTSQDNPTRASTTSPTITTTFAGGADILLITSAVTAYIALLRIWRLIFSQFHDLLTSNSTTGVDMLSKLPNLQLGGFQVQCNPKVQMAVLLELSTSMLQLIDNRFGIGVPSGYANVKKGQQARNTIFGMSSVAISIRDTLLSQETFRVAAENPFGDLSLMDLVTEVKSQLK
ncbi:hypothetical protein F5Y06DRAFT_275185 [Hypoxylon sp. FL0890]|nr:hypothetical protein F5Y06DRAFT_275185 [Hypoxylon sp. FL0890]